MCLKVFSFLFVGRVAKLKKVEINRRHSKQHQLVKLQIFPSPKNLKRFFNELM
jgi:hypothetical protein